MKIIEVRGEPGLYHVINFHEPPAHRRPKFRQPRAEHSPRFWLAIIAVALLVLITAVLVDHASAQPITDLAAGNRGGCAEGNRMRGLACVVSDFTPGYVSGTCDGGYWFKNARTARTFTLEQPVTVQGCIMAGSQLASAPGWPLRISK